MKPVIVALDVADEVQALQYVKNLSSHVDLFKVGPPLYLKFPNVVARIKDLGKDVFLDLKFHDIPNTVEASVRSAASLGVYSLTLHVSGGREMLKRAAQIAGRPKLWGVTVLTSQEPNDRKELGFEGTAEEAVPRYAKLAQEAGLDGVVSSVHEVASIKKICGASFVCVTPGIRLKGDALGDQKRVATPEAAARAGADFLVVGRPILESKNPSQVIEEIYDQIESKS